MNKKRIKGYLLSAVVIIVIAMISLPSSAAKVDVTVAYYTSNQGYKSLLFESAIKAYNNSQKRVNVIAEPIYGDYYQTIYSRAMIKNPPDIAFFEPENIARFINMDLLLDLTPYIKRDRYDVDDFHPQLLQAFVLNNKTYGLPFFTQFNVLAYNKDMFKKAGVAYPTENWSWDDLLNMARKLTIREQNGKAKQFGFTGFFDFGMSLYDVYSLLWSNGADFFDKPDYPTQSVATSKDVIDSISFIKDFRFKYGVERLPEEASKHSLEHFASGESAISAAYLYLDYYLKDSGSSFDWGLQVYPKGKKSQSIVLYTVGYSILKGSKNPDAAWDFLKFFLSAKGQKHMQESLGLMPYSVRKSLMKDALKNLPKGADSNLILKSLAFGRPYMFRLPNVYQSDVQFALYINLPSVLNGKVEVRDGMAKLKEELDKLINQTRW